MKKYFALILILPGMSSFSAPQVNKAYPNQDTLNIIHTPKKDSPTQTATQQHTLTKRTLLTEEEVQKQEEDDRSFSY